MIDTYISIQLIIILAGVGTVLKSFCAKFSNTIIPLTLLILGITLSLIFYGITIDSIATGVVSALLSTGSHQFIKQSLDTINELKTK